MKPPNNLSNIKPTAPVDDSIYLRKLAETPIPKLSKQLWRELRYLGRIEQRIKKWEQELLASLREDN